MFESKLPEVLPEFIPFTNEYGSKQKDQISIPSPHSTSSRSQKELRSPNFHNPDRNSSNRSEHRGQKMQENGDKPPHARVRYRSPQQTHEPYVDQRRNSPAFGHNSRNRSRSPVRQNSNYRNDRAIEYHGSSDRVSSERNRNGSVFDRMSSPPPLQRRRFGGEFRRSADSNSNGPKPNFFRSVNVLTPARGYDDSIYQTNDPQTAEINPLMSRFLQRERSPQTSRQYGCFLEAEDLRNASVATGLMTSDESSEMRNLRQRLIDAEKHCYGLETTVKSYQREILKLRSIVNELADDFEVIRARIRWTVNRCVQIIRLFWFGRVKIEIKRIWLIRH